MEEPPHRKPRKFAAGISLDKFAKLKKSTFDKREKLEKQRKLNAATVNKYKKLKERLGDKREPKFKLMQVRPSPLSRCSVPRAAAPPPFDLASHRRLLWPCRMSPMRMSSSKCSSKRSSMSSSRSKLSKGQQTRSSRRSRAAPFHRSISWRVARAGMLHLEDVAGGAAGVAEAEGVVATTLAAAASGISRSRTYSALQPTSRQTR